MFEESGTSEEKQGSLGLKLKWQCAGDSHCQGHFWHPSLTLVLFIRIRSVRFARRALLIWVPTYDFFAPKLNPFNNKKNLCECNKNAPQKMLFSVRNFKISLKLLWCFMNLMDFSSECWWTKKLVFFVIILFFMWINIFTFMECFSFFFLLKTLIKNIF